MTSGSRLIHLVLLGCSLGTLQEPFVSKVAAESLPENPADYLPLEVGNRWTYIHSYENTSYYFVDEILHNENSFELSELEVPGYPFGMDNRMPDDSLLVIPGLELKIEITHSEVIDGDEYFVFSGPQYEFPPLPPYFWAGKKVRLAQEGKLIFHEEGQDISVYNFGPDFLSFTPTNQWKNGENYQVSQYIYQTPVGSGARFVWKDGNGNPIFFHLMRYIGTEIRWPVYSAWFFEGFGLASFESFSPDWLHTGYPLDPLFVNRLEPVSATISGETIVNETSWGRLKKSSKR